MGMAFRSSKLGRSIGRMGSLGEEKAGMSFAVDSRGFHESRPEPAGSVLAPRDPMNGATRNQVRSSAADRDRQPVERRYVA
jgi:hypothetical protein